MGTKVTFNSATKIIQVTQPPIDGIVDIDVKIDIYSDGKEDWLADATLNKFKFPVTAVGGDPLPGAKALGSTFFLEYGWVIRPYESDHTMQVSGNLYSRDDDSPYITTVGNFNVFTIQSVSSLITTVESTGSVNKSELAQAVWDHQVDGVLPGSMGEIQKRQSFQGHIHVDFTNGTNGTAYPQGTHVHPVKTMAEAVSIGLIEGISKIIVKEDITIFAADNVDGFTIIGAHAIKSEITIEAGAQTQLTQFINFTLTGEPNGRIIIRDSVINDLLNFEGIMFQTAINGTITLASTANAVSFVLGCYSGVPGHGAPTIDFNDTPHSIAVRGFSGGLKFENKSLAQPVSVDFESGQLILDGTVTAGEIVVRGIYHLTDNSGGTTTVIRDTNLDDIEIKIDNVQITADAIEVDLGNVALVIDDLIRYQRNKSIIDPFNHTLTIYEDDGTTPLTTFNLQDDNGVASVISIFRRIPQ